MKKTLLTTALAFVLAIGGLTASAQDATQEVTNPSKIENLGSLKFTMANVATNELDGKSFKANLAKASEVDGKSFGYLSGNEFVSLGSAMENASILLPYNKVIEFGYGSSANDFVATNVSLKVNADSGYYTGYNNENFFQLDFSQDPFDGMIEVLVMGEPLPASTVSLLVALGAGAAFLLYHNRRRRIGAVEQA